MNKELQENNLVDLNTIVVPSHPKGFDEVFLKQRRWPNLKIDKDRKEHVKFIAVYQTRPVSAITHYAEIERFEPLPRVGRYNVFFKGNPIEIRPVPFTSADICAVQGPRYTTLINIQNAKNLTGAFHI